MLIISFFLIFFEKIPIKYLTFHRFVLYFISKRKVIQMKSLVNFRLAVFLTAGLILGISFSYCCVFGKIFGVVATILSAVAAFIVFTFFSSAKFKSTGKILCFLFFSLSFAVGGIGFKITVDNYNNADLNGHILSVSGKIDEISAKDDYSVIIVSSVNFSGVVSGDSRYKIALYVYGENDTQRRDTAY